MLKRLHKIFVVLSVLAIAAFVIYSHPIAATRPLAFVPTGSGFIKVTSGTESSTASAVTLSGSDVSGTLGVANGGTGASTLTANAVLLGNGTSAPGTVAPSTNGNVLTSNGTTWVSSVPASQSSLGIYASRPAAGSVGKRYIATDSFAEFFDDGSVWRPLIFGRAGYEPPSVGGFTNYSHGGIMGAEVPTNNVGTIQYVYDNYNGAGEEVRTSVHNMPGGAYSLTVFVRILPAVSGTLTAGLTFRQSSDGSIEQFCIASTTGSFLISRHRATASGTGTSPTYTFNSDVTNTSNWFNTGTSGLTGLWMRITDDRAGTRQFYFSLDGLTFFEALSIKVTGNAFITADQAGFHSWCSSCSPGGGYVGAIFYSLKEN